MTVVGFVGARSHTRAPAGDMYSTTIRADIQLPSLRLDRRTLAWRLSTLDPLNAHTICVRVILLAWYIIGGYAVHAMWALHNHHVTR